MKNIFNQFCLFILIGAFIAPAFSQESAGACSVTGKTANLDFSLQDMNGNEVKLSDFKGQVILLDFWATWCGPCRIEIPGFIELFDKYQEQGLQILGISVDDPVDSLLLYAEEMEMNYPVLVGDGRDDVKDAFGPLYGFPSTFLINREGNICHQHTGFAPKEKFEEEILQLL
ncbi:MAG: TlpA family protein disulfide reductase [Gammaproteobacteria bacterium]|nr:TlpA family protein disulfide reductase [Gammaproteobacteria bacterium]